MTDKLRISHRIVRHLAAFLLGLGGSTAAAQSQLDQDPSVIDLVLKPESATDKRIQLLMPPAASPDKIAFTNEGLRIKQTSEGGAAAKTCGLTLQASSSGPFVFMMDFALERLDAPQANRAQGMWIRMVFEDQTPAFGLVASSKTKRGLAATRAHSDSPKLQFAVEPLDFQRGTWIIERKGPDLQLSVGETEFSFREVKRIPSPPGPLKEIQVWCSRFSSGNRPAEITIERLRFVGADYLQRPPPAPPILTVGRIVWTCVSLGLLCALGVTGYKLYDKFR